MVHSHCAIWTSSIEPKSSHQATWPGAMVSPNGYHCFPSMRLSKSYRTAQTRSMTQTFANYSHNRPSLTKRRSKVLKVMVRVQRAIKAMQKLHLRRQIPRRSSMQRLLMECFTIAQTRKHIACLSPRRTLGRHKRKNQLRSRLNRSSQKSAEPIGPNLHQTLLNSKKLQKKLVLASSLSLKKRSKRRNKRSRSVNELSRKRRQSGSKLA